MTLGRRLGLFHFFMIADQNVVATSRVCLAGRHQHRNQHQDDWRNCQPSSDKEPSH